MITIAEAIILEIKAMIALPFWSRLTVLVVQWQLFKRNAKKCVFFLISVIFGGCAEFAKSIYHAK